MDDSFDLRGKVALVTGASRGIGESIAQLLAAHGAHLVVSSRKAEACARVVSDIEKAGGHAEAMACHVGDPSPIADARFTTALVEDEALPGQYLGQVPLARVAQLSEIAGAVLYLVSPAASYTTGVRLPVDGGYLVK